MTAQCGASAMPWWACSAGGECVSLVNNSTRTNDTSTTILAAAAKCVCSAAYTGAVPLWIVPANAAIGDCHVHSLTHVILEWATLIACMLGFFYCLLRMLVGLPRGMRACCSSFVAASSLGFDCLPLYRIIVRLSSWCGSHRDTYSDESEQTRSTSTTNTRASGTRYRNNSNKKRISDALIADEFSPVQQQYFAARGISVHACLSLLLVGLFFLTAVCGSFDVIRSSLPSLYVAVWSCLGVGICGVTFCVAHMGQRQVTVAFGRAFRQMQLQIASANSSNNSQQQQNSDTTAAAAVRTANHRAATSLGTRANNCLTIGRYIMLTVWITSCAAMTTGLALTANAALRLSTELAGSSSSSAAETMFDRQLLGVRIFGIGMGLGCGLFAVVTVASASFIVHILQQHLSHVSSVSTTVAASVPGGDSTSSTGSSNSSSGTDSEQQQQQQRLRHNDKHYEKSIRQIHAVILKLRRLRMLVGICLFASLCLSAVLVVIPGSIEYVFPIAIINAALLLPGYMSIDSGVPSASVVKDTADDDETNTAARQCGPCLFSGMWLLTVNQTTTSRGSSSSSALSRSRGAADDDAVPASASSEHHNHHHHHTSSSHHAVPVIQPLSVMKGRPIVPPRTVYTRSDSEAHLPRPHASSTTTVVTL